METASSFRKASQELRKVDTRIKIWRRIRQSWQLYFLLALPVVWLMIFQYYPMYGAQIAFRDFLPGDSIWRADWVGLENFKRFFQSAMFVTLLRNTLTLSLYSLAASFPIPIIFALSLNQLRNRYMKQTIQMVSYAPHFISTVVLVGILIQFLGLHNGPINLALQALGFAPHLFMGDSNYFQSIYVWSAVWQDTGFSAIIYLAALSNIDPLLHEAAVVDGANRLQRIWHIDLPEIMPTVVTLLILSMGQIINIGFEKVYLMQNPLNTSISEVISTYVYKVGLIGSFTNFSYAAAIGLFNSVVGMVMLIAANQVLKKVTETSLW